jgi:16S rRNA (guanine(966)-N(2))-methyltransferase RsmD
MGDLRVIAGKAKGLRLKSVPGTGTRPIADRVKEALFNIIGGDIVSSKWLDLFAGTGAVGIEALSRGAANVTFLDMSRLAIQTIHENLAHTMFDKTAQVVQTDSLLYLGRYPNHEFDYIYVAPPQYKQIWKKSMQLLDEKPGWLIDDGWIIVQIHPVEYERLDLLNFVEFDQRKYGSTLLVFFEKKILTAQTG